MPSGLPPDPLPSPRARGLPNAHTHSLSHCQSSPSQRRGIIGPWPRRSSSLKYPRIPCPPPPSRVVTHARRGSGVPGGSATKCLTKVGETEPCGGHWGTAFHSSYITKWSARYCSGRAPAGVLCTSQTTAEVSPQPSVHSHTWTLRVDRCCCWPMHVSPLAFCFSLSSRSRFFFIAPEMLGSVTGADGGAAVRTAEGGGGDWAWRAGEPAPRRQSRSRTHCSAKQSVEEGHSTATSTLQRTGGTPRRGPPAELPLSGGGGGREGGVWPAPPPPTPTRLSLRTKMHCSRFFPFSCRVFVVKADDSFLKVCC